MTIPSSLDPTLAPEGQHVVQLFTQYTPYTLSGGQEWTEELKNKYANVGQCQYLFKSVAMLKKTHKLYREKYKFFCIHKRIIVVVVIIIIIILCNNST